MKNNDIKCVFFLGLSIFLTLILVYFPYNYCNNESIQDSYAIRDILLENHPAIYNQADQPFHINFKKGFNETLNVLKTVNNYEEAFVYLEKWINAFDDPHLRIRKIISNNNQIQNDCSQAFERHQWTEDTVYIKIPTFQLSSEAQLQLTKIITAKPTLRNAKNTIFDVRGNGGGSSLWGQKITNALFGPDYMKQRRYLYEKRTEVDWRASKGNLAYMQTLLPIIKEQFHKSSSEYTIVTTICNELEEAIKKISHFSRRNIRIYMVH